MGRCAAGRAGRGCLGFARALAPVYGKGSLSLLFCGLDIHTAVSDFGDPFGPFCVIDINVPLLGLGATEP